MTVAAIRKRRDFQIEHKPKPTAWYELGHPSAPFVISYDFENGTYLPIDWCRTKNVKSADIYYLDNGKKFRNKGYKKRFDSRLTMGC